MTSNRLLRYLMRLLPFDVREAHGADMIRVLRDARGEQPPTWRAGAAFWTAAAIDILRVAPRQHAEAVMRDLSYAMRGLRRAPAFSLAAILTIALGTGATAAIFAVVNAVLIRPLPYDDPSRVALVWATDPDGARTWLSAPEVADIADRSTTLTSVAGMTDLRLALTGRGEPEELGVVAASASLFPLLGARPHLGRFFDARDDVENAPRVAVLGHGLWMRRFGGAADVVGATVILDSRPYTVIGVTPAEFGVLPPSSVFPVRVDVWVPLQTHLVSRARDVRYLHAIARVGSAVAFDTAKQELAAIGASVSRDFASDYRGRRWSFDLVRMQDDVVAGVKPALLVLFAIVGGVLLIACANVAALLLSRGDARQREMSIRAALGASRARLVRQLLTEGFVLAAIGGAAGLLLAVAAPVLGRVPALADLPRFSEIAVDWHVVAFAAAAAMMTALLFTLAPAIELTRRHAGRAQEGLRTAARGRAAVRAGRLLTIAEIALASAVLVTALALAQRFAILLDVDPGFTVDRVITARVSLPPTYDGPGRTTRFFDAVLENLRRSTGIESASAVSQLPLSGASLGSSFVDAANASGEPIRIDADLRAMTPGYFDTLGVRVIEGRAIAATDVADSPAVAVVDELFARRLSPGGSAIGRRFRWIRQPDRTIEVVGVVRPVRHRGAVQDARATVYRPNTQYPRFSMFLAARTGADASQSASALRTAVHAVDPSQPVADVRTMESRAGRSLAQPGFGASLGAALAALALVLAAIGVYGLLAYSVAQRTREVGVRLAIGATPGGIVGMVLGEGARLTIAGIVLGLIGGAIGSQWMTAAFPGGVRPDRRAFAAAAAVMLFVALAACWLPARRASRVDPTTALRADP